MPLTLHRYVQNKKLPVYCPGKGLRGLVGFSGQFGRFGMLGFLGILGTINLADYPQCKDLVSKRPARLMLG
jgi:hypothetical protein